MKIRNLSRPGFEPRTFGLAYLCSNHETTAALFLRGKRDAVQNTLSAILCAEENGVGKVPPYSGLLKDCGAHSLGGQSTDWMSMVCVGQCLWPQLFTPIVYPTKMAAVQLLQHVFEDVYMRSASEACLSACLTLLLGFCNCSSIYQTLCSFITNIVIAIFVI